ncbi:MAG: hypothetical protein P4L87_15080, partial [Formivibrio sp.]|nr:hypothetical protein [Formivibrio sp.]
VGVEDVMALLLSRMRRIASALNVGNSAINQGSRRLVGATLPRERFSPDQVSRRCAVHVPTSAKTEDMPLS